MCKIKYFFIHFNCEKMEEKENIYPVIKTKEVEELLKNKTEKGLNAERLNYMIKENKTLEELIHRFDRIRNSWGKADSVAKVIGSVVTLLMGISIIILPAIGGIVAIPLAIIESILGGTANLTGFTSAMISMRWTKRKKRISCKNKINRRIKN